METMPRPDTSSLKILKRLDNMEQIIEWIADEMLRVRHDTHYTLTELEGVKK